MVNVRPEWRQNIHSPVVLIDQTVTFPFSIEQTAKSRLCILYFCPFEKYDHVQKKKITQGSVNFFFQS